MKTHVLFGLIHIIPAVTSMLKSVFRPLFVIFFLSSMVLGQVLPLDSTVGLFERDDVRERSWSETADTSSDAGGHAPALADWPETAAGGPHAGILYASSFHVSVLPNARLTRFSPRSPPFSS